MGDYGGGGYSPAAGGGTVNTGNAAVGDVAVGKTFSSAVLTNSTGTSTKDATVGGSAKIQPPQAFVNNIAKLSAHSSATLDLSDQGITSFNGTLLYDGEANPTTDAHSFLAVGALTSSWSRVIDLSGNALDAASINSILAALVNLFNTLELSGSPPNVDLTGGTNAAPTGQGIIDLATLTNDAGWTVTTN